MRRAALGAFGVLLLYAVLLGASVFSMYKAADGAAGELASFKQQVLGGDYASALQTGSSLAQRAANLDRQASGPVWAIASALPVVGSDAATLRVASGVAHALCDQLLMPMVGRLEANGAGPIVRGDNSIDADTAQIMLEAIGEASPEIGRRNVAAYGLGKCRFGQAEDIRRQMRGALGALATLSEVSDQLATRIHWLLGAEGETRAYLLVAQNNVEIRATGGYPGSLGPLYIDNGKMQVGDFVAVTSLGRFDDYNLSRQIFADPMPISSEEETLFGTRVQLVPGDANYNFSFPRAAQMWEYTWKITGRGAIDGVLAIDPVFLQELLTVIGSLQTMDGTTVTGDNAATLLMHDIYWTRSPAEQDEFFAEVAKLTFGTLTSRMSEVDAVDLARVFWHGKKDGRLLAFTNDADAQNALQQVGCAGEIKRDSSNPVLGVYFNDDTWSKMFWYFSTDTAIGKSVQNPDGSKSYRVRTTARNNIPQSELDALPDYVAGHSYRCRSKGDMVYWIYLVAPEGGRISDVSADGFFSDPQRLKLPYYGSALTRGMNEATYEGLDVWFCMPQIEPGEQTVIEYTVITAPSVSGTTQQPLVLDTTPTAQGIAGW